MRAQSDNATYIRRLGSVVTAATRSRHILLHELKMVRADSTAALPRAGRIAAICAQAFDEARWVVVRAETPRGAELCSETLIRWLDSHLDACDAIARAAGTGDRAHLSTANAALRKSSEIASQFNAARQLLARRLAA